MISIGPRRGVLLALMVVGLLAGLVGMHHVAGEAHAATSVSMSVSMSHPAGESEAPPAGRDPSLLHLCLAILVAGAPAVAVVLLGWWHPAGVPPVSSVAVRRARPAPRAPPASAPGRLALLCVLRT
jgi:ABC-type uncharacterized transport system permease subunit